MSTTIDNISINDITPDQLLRVFHEMLNSPAGKEIQKLIGQSCPKQEGYGEFDHIYEPRPGLCAKICGELIPIVFVGISRDRIENFVIIDGMYEPASDVKGYTGVQLEV